MEEDAQRAEFRHRLRVKRAFPPNSVGETELARKADHATSERDPNEGPPRAAVASDVAAGDDAQRSRGDMPSGPFPGGCRGLRINVASVEREMAGARPRGRSMRCSRLSRKVKAAAEARRSAIVSLATMVGTMLARAVQEATADEVLG